MDRLSLLLSFAIGWLALSYVLFTSQQYFSVASICIMFAIALAAFLTFILVYRHSSAGKLVFDMKTDRKLLALLIIITILVIFEIYFNAGSGPALSQLVIVLLLVLGGVAISIGGIYALRRLTLRLKGNVVYAAILIGALITGSLAYGLMYGIRGVSWNGIDELGFNYYASYLFAHGTNPYVTSMQPILQQHNIFPTVQLDGTFEYAYDYPALSFLPYIFMPLLGISSFFVFILIAIVLAVLASYIVYRKSGYNNSVLMPIALWLFVTFTLVGTSNQYLAVSFLFLIAYLERKNVLLSGVLLGLASAVIQLVWFAIPFFIVLVYREMGSKPLLKLVGAAILAFAIVNGYFIIASPSAFFANIFAVFGLTKLVFYGPNVMQLLVSHYYVASWYPAVISVIALVASLGLFYLYTDTLRPMIAVVPAMIFFLSWRNISIYGLPFVPVILAIYYVHDSNHKVKDILNERRPIIYVAVGMLALFAAIAIYSHITYTKTDHLSIASITPVIYGQAGFSGPFSLGGLKVNVINAGSKAENVSFYIVSRNPDGEEYILGPGLNTSIDLQSLPAHSSYNYTLEYQLPTVNNNTKLYVFAFSPDYITTRQYQLQLSH